MNHIKRIATPALLAIAIAGLTACGNNDRNDADVDPAVTDTTADTAAQTGTGMDPALGDNNNNTANPDEAAALGVLNAINEHEIATSEQALAKGVTGPVADYARMMIDQHGQNRTQTSALGPDADAQDAQAQRQKAEQERSTLDQLEGEAYSKAYVDAMVKGHQDALTLIDTRLLPAATDDNVRAFLTASREHVAMHLERGRALQGKLGGAAQ